MEKPGGRPSMGSHRVGHDWSDLAEAAAIFHCICIPQFLYPFICWWSHRLLPCPNYCKKCCNKHWSLFAILWPPHVKNWLIGKDSDAGRDWGQDEKGTTEDEMAGWHHWLDGRESEWIPGVGDGQGGLACCDSWGCKESDMTERLNWTELTDTSVCISKKGDNLINHYSIITLKHSNNSLECLTISKPTITQLSLKSNVFFSRLVLFRAQCTVWYGSLVSLNLEHFAPSSLFALFVSCPWLIAVVL